MTTTDPRRTRPEGRRPTASGSTRQVPGEARPGRERATTRTATNTTGRPAGPTPTRRSRPAATPPPAKARSHRGRRARRDLAVRVDLRKRSWIVLALLSALLVAAGVKLVFIQAIDAEALATAGANQRTKSSLVPAVRGSISDRNGAMLAFTIEGRAVAGRPAKFVSDDPTATTVKSYSGEKNPPRTADDKRALVAALIADTLGPDFREPDGSVLTEAELLERLTDPDRTYVYLAHKVLPAQSDTILSGVQDILTEPEIDGVSAEREAIRKTPDGVDALTVVGRTGWDESGLSGIEAKFNALLTGQDGSITQQVYAGGNPIPNTVTDRTAAVNGTAITLTLDNNLQYAVGELVAEQVKATGARKGCAIVQGIADGQVYAMVCFYTDEVPDQEKLGATGWSFEPGSVNKVITFSAALEKQLIEPTTVLSVDGRISVSGRWINDAWQHGPIDMTAAGILAKSSNVGTLMLAQQIGEDAFSEQMAKFGLGSKTGFELYEESGQVPKEWSGTTFGNLPIGQGVSVTLLQLASMYQAIGNKGVRITPTIVAGTTAPGGTFTPSTTPTTAEVMTEQTATTLTDMLRATVQDGDQAHRGTAVPAAITGYQVAGKTGTAQQVDPLTKAYSDTKHNATFVGIVPADAPRFSIAVVLDAPVVGSEGGTSAAPLFHDIAAYAMRAYNVPPSTQPAPVYDLYVGPNQ